MSASSLPEKTRSPLQTRRLDEETVIQANIGEAARLYQRGMAAARGGQKRIAAGLLTRSIQLDPHNEGAWLWLSGVLDDPQQIAFCLNSVLKLNPNNERARKGLRWLQEKHQITTTSASSATLPLPDVQMPINEPELQRQARQQGESWWVNWRQWHRDSRRVNLMWWAMPIVVLLLALLIHRSFASAIAESNTPPPLPSTSTSAPPGVQAALPQVQPVTPILENEPASLRESRTLVYFEQLGPLRQNLRDAVDKYRSATGKPGDAMNHIAAAQELHTSVQQAYEQMQQMQPPADLMPAHREYIKGLERELAAINDMLEFYGSYRVELANRAVLRFQQANTHFDRARTLFDVRLQQLRYESTISVHTIR
jgi:tetratricopeptide (TPR) repeat protein